LYSQTHEEIMFMEQVIKVVNLIAESHPFYSGIAFGFAAREFLFSLKPKCEICKK